MYIFVFLSMYFSGIAGLITASYTASRSSYPHIGRVLCRYDDGGCGNIALVIVFNRDLGLAVGA